jgi:hypothetical protein
MKRNVRILAAAGAACLLVTTIGCNKKTEQASTSTAGGQTSSAPSGQQAAQQKMALVRFVNATPGQNVDLWFGGTKVFPDIAYKAVTAYREIPGERHDFILEPAGARPTNDSKVKNSEGLTDGAHYTVVAMLDKDRKQKLDVINDDLSQPASGRSKVRVINASNEEVDVLSPVDRKEGSADRMKTPPATPERDRTRYDRDNGLDKWFSGVNADSSTSYKEVDPVTTRLEVRPSSGVGHRHSAIAPAATVPVDLAPGKLYTLVITGGEHGRALDVVRVTDELTGTPEQPAGKRS